MDHDLDAVKAEWVGRPFATADFTIDTQRLLDAAVSCGETEARFVDPDDPDFQGHPTFTASLGTGKMLPDDFPELGNGHGIDGGKSIVVHTPIRPGDVITAQSTIADVYAKTGRSGTMIFVVHRIDFTNQHGEPVSTVDWRMIRATGPR